VAVVDGRAVTWGDLVPRLAERMGGATLQEFVLDVRLEREMKANGVEFPGGEAAAVEAERRAFLKVLTAAGLGGGGDGERVLTDLRRARGMGDQWFALLCRRTAMLRALVAPSVVVDEPLVRGLYERRYGEKRVVQVVVTATAEEAAAALALVVEGGTPVSAERFAAVAREFSTDESARSKGGKRGTGQLAPLSLMDPTTPGALRAAVAGLRAPGDVSGVFGLEGRFAVARLEGVVPAEGVDFESVKGELLASARLELERGKMDVLAARLLAEPGVTVLDRGVDWSWQNLAQPGGTTGGGTGGVMGGP
jgi:hypothetical protein